MAFSPFGAGSAIPAVSPFIGAQAGANDLAISPGFAAYPAANATVFRVFEFAVPVTSVATVPSVTPIGATAPIGAGNIGLGGFGGFGGFGGLGGFGGFGG